MVTTEPAAQSEDHDDVVGFDSTEVCQIVGSRVRELRQAMGVTMAAFAESADISLGMLSKIEHGQTAPSLATMVRLSRAAQVPLTALFRGLDEERDIVIIRAGEGHEIIHEGSGPGRTYTDLGSLRGPNRVIEPLLTELTEADEVFPLYQHPGIEIIHILDGKMEYGFGPSRYEIAAGDTMQFHGEVAHGPTKLIELPVRFLSIKVYPPPTTD